MGRSVEQKAAIDGTRLQGRQLGLGLRQAQFERHFRKGGPEATERFRDRRTAGAHVVELDRQNANLAMCRRQRARAQSLDVGEDAHGAVQKHIARGRELHAMRGAFEQPGLQFLLERLNLA